MNNTKTAARRQKRVRAKLTGTSGMPRLSVHRTNAAIYAQLIDDQKGVTILGVSEKLLETKGTKTEKAQALGNLLAQKAKEAKIKKVVFDRGKNSYHGRIAALAKGAREGGLDF